MQNSAWLCSLGNPTAVKRTGMFEALTEDCGTLTLMAEVSQRCACCLCFSDHLGVDSFGQNRMVLFIVSHPLASKNNLAGHMQ